MGALGFITFRLDTVDGNVQFGACFMSLKFDFSPMINTGFSNIGNLLN